MMNERRHLGTDQFCVGELIVHSGCLSRGLIHNHSMQTRVNAEQIYARVEEGMEYEIDVAVDTELESFSCRCRTPCRTR